MKCNVCGKFMKKQAVIDSQLEPEIVQWWSCLCGNEYPDVIWDKSRKLQNVGIVGHEEAKFTDVTEKAAKAIIKDILRYAKLMISGGCHLGGIDIWAEEIADEMGIPKLIFKPKNLKWKPHGYRERNLKIADSSDVVHCIVVSEYPENYNGMRFKYCYHCNTNKHIKSGGCWTAKRAKKAVWHVIHSDGTIESHYEQP